MRPLETIVGPAAGRGAGARSAAGLRTGASRLGRISRIASAGIAFRCASPSTRPAATHATALPPRSEVSNPNGTAKAKTPIARLASPRSAAGSRLRRTIGRAAAASAPRRSTSPGRPSWAAAPSTRLCGERVSPPNPTPAGQSARKASAAARHPCPSPGAPSKPLPTAVQVTPGTTIAQRIAAAAAPTPRVRPRTRFVRRVGATARTVRIPALRARSGPRGAPTTIAPARNGTAARLARRIVRACRRTASHRAARSPRAAVSTASSGSKGDPGPTGEPMRAPDRQSTSAPTRPAAASSFASSSRSRERRPTITAATSGATFATKKSSRVDPPWVERMAIQMPSASVSASGTLSRTLGGNACSSRMTATTMPTASHESEMTASPLRVNGSDPTSWRQSGTTGASASGKTGERKASAAPIAASASARTAVGGARSSASARRSAATAHSPVSCVRAIMEPVAPAVAHARPP